MPSRVETVLELKSLFKQAFIPVPPYESGGPQQGPPQGDPNAQPPPAGGPPPEMPPQGPPPEQGGAPPAEGAPPQGAAPGAVPLPPEVASIIDKVVSSQQQANQRLQALEAQFEQDKLLRDKDREAAEKRRQLIETVLPAASI